MRNETEIVIVGGGAAGVAAARRLHDSGIDCLLVEARSRLGGRALTRGGQSPLDLGCGWLHSADRNPWVAIAKAQGRTVDRTPPPWRRPALTFGFPLPEQDSFRAAHAAFHDRLAAAAAEPDAPAATHLDRGERWNALINAVSTYASGTELDRLSAHDFGRYDDTDVNWRVVEGYGTTVAAHAAGVPVVVDCPVRRIDHGGSRLRIETATGDLVADAAIVAVPTTLLAAERLAFTPALPDKIEAAAGLPLGLADKLFLSLAQAEEFPAESRVIGRTDRTGTGAYHFRPFGRPQIEGYFGGRLAAELEAGGAPAFVDFAVGELKGLLGGDFAKRVRLLDLHAWGVDPFARGSYSFALPGKAEGRATLAAPVDGRLFFAGEACSLDEFSTAHGAYKSGIAAAEQAIAARRHRAAGPRSS
jgi:monoamine oxidase